MKLPDEHSGALLVRDEVVFEGSPTTPPRGAVDLVQGYLRRAELVPKVRLRAVRRGVLLNDVQGPLIADVVDDRVSVLDGQRVVAGFRELEVETTNDTPTGLLKAVLLRLRAAAAGAPDPTPKYLRAIGGADMVSPEIVPPSRSASVGEVVTHAIASSVIRLLRHDPVVRLGTDPEGVHQARVATRRLRSDLRTFRTVLDQLIEAAQTPALVEAKAGRGATKALPSIVSRAWRALDKYVKALPDQPADEDLHRVRILAKRCRYAAEAFAPSLGKRTHKLASAASQLQDVLGLLNDAVVAERWLHDWATNTDSGASGFVAGELAALEHAAAAHEARSRWLKVWKRLKTNRPTRT